MIESREADRAHGYSLRPRERRSPRLNRPALALLYILSAAAVAAICISSISTARNADPVFVYRLVLGLAVVATSCTAALLGGRLWTATVAYMGAFSLFHFGLIGVVGLGFQTGDEIAATNARWIFTPAAAEAAVVALIALLGYTIGGILGRFRIQAVWAGTRGVPRARGDDPRFERRITIVGALLLWCSIGAWLVAVVRAGGLAAVVGSYGAYLEGTAQMGSVMTWVWFGLGLGIVTILTARATTTRRIAILPLLVFLPIALGLGLRGEVLFPLASAGVLLQWQGRPFSTKRTVLALTAGLFLIAVIRNLREVGLARANDTALQGSVVSGLAELGGTLRTVAVAITWRDEGDPYTYGATYWAPIDRALPYLLPGWRRPPAEQDDRLMNVLVARRVGPIGFSPVAEAFRNFGPAGVGVVMLLIGLLMAKLDRLQPTRLNQLTGSAIFIPFLINIRNSFVFVPAQIVLGVAILLVVRRAPIIYQSR